MKRKAILAIILVFCMCLCACGEKPAAKIETGDFAYQVTGEGQDVAKLDNEYPKAIALGYEATDGYLTAGLTDEEAIKIFTDSFKKVTVGDAIAEEDIVYYPSRSIEFGYADDSIIYYLAADSCYIYDSKKDVLNFYELENSDEFLAYFDLMIIASNPDAFDTAYHVYEDSDCSCSITNYSFDDKKGTFNLDFAIDNQSAESRIFTITDFAINGTAVETGAVFAVDAGKSVDYTAPVDLFGYKESQISEITFKIRVTNDSNNPSYVYDTETVTLAIAE